MTELLCKGLNDDSVSILIGGEAGQGISRSGSLLGHSFIRGGFHAFGTNEYPSLIRGGHNYYILRTSTREVFSQDEKIDVVVALNKETAVVHESELNPSGNIIVDEDAIFTDGELKRGDVNVYRVPLTRIVKELGGPEIMRNTVALGAVLGLIGLDHTIMKDVVAATFAKKEVAEMNRKAIDRGYEYVKERFDGFNCEINGVRALRDRVFLTGNDALALGAVSSGCKFYAAYPMTPASPILDYMMNHDEATKMVVIQGESELAVMNMVVGASYGGVRAMAATSGGGFSLMTEALGLAAMTESPVIVNLGQRPGPSTGLATHSAQGDLLFALNASQGEFPRIIIAPSDVDDCFYLTKHAFNFADRFQVPVILLTDKYLAESEIDTLPFDPDYVPIDRGKTVVIDEYSGGGYGRYAFTDDGVSPMLLPGTKGAIVKATSNEHDDRGYSSSKPNEVVAMVDKRFKKVPFIEKEVKKLNLVNLYGDPSADITLVSWGGNKGPILEAIRLLVEDGLRARLLQVVFMDPFPGEELKSELGKSKETLLIENNKTAQLGKLIKLHTGFVFDNVLLRYDGRPFNPSEIRRRVMEVVGR